MKTNLIEPVSEVVRQTRAKLMPFWGNAGVVSYKEENAASVVTKLDFEIEAFFTEELKKIDPNVTFAGEEFGGSRESERFWLCDPIDGTAHFIRGLPFCTVMLALIENQQVTHAFIYDFVNDDLYTAQKGGGAHKNGQLLRVSERSLAESYIGWESHIDKSENLKTFMRLREKCGLFKCIASGYEFAMVAEGKLDGRVQFDPWGKDYDFAPGSLLVSEAGGVVANLGVHTYDYRNRDFIAANKNVFDSLTSGENAIFPLKR